MKQGLGVERRSLILIKTYDMASRCFWSGMIEICDGGVMINGQKCDMQFAISQSQCRKVGAVKVNMNKTKTTKGDL